MVETSVLKFISRASSEGREVIVSRPAILISPSDQFFAAMV